MSGVKVDILWSRTHDDRFVTFGPELSLYKVDQSKEGSSKGLSLSDDTSASLLSVNNDNQFMKCLAWHPKAPPDNLLAVGLATGKVVLTSFGKGSSGDPYNLIGKEFTPRHARQCNDLAWNSVDNNLLATALDKYRNDNSILIWDVNITRHVSDLGYGKHAGHGVDNSITKPLVELGPSETTLSLSWFNHGPKILVTGMNHKFLRIFDLRDISRPQSVAFTKAVSGVAVDPHFEHRLASFGNDHDGKVCIWDTRNFDKPVVTLHESHHVIKLAWTPTRCGLLGVLPKDSAVIKLYDIQQTSVGTDELEPAVIERLIQPFSQGVIASFDWHWTHENRMLTVNSSGTLRDLRICERIAVDWSPDIYLTWACGRKLMQCHSIKLCKDAHEDISIKMKRRALKGYGTQTSQLWQNGQLVGDDTPLRNLWIWLDLVKTLMQSEDGGKGKTLSRSGINYIGVKAILKEPLTGQTRSDLDFLQWQGMDGASRPKNQKRIFRSEERSKALLLCGWGFDKDNIGEALDRLEAEGEFERAAAIGLFNLYMRRAIQSLKHGASSKQKKDINLNVVAMALSGYTDEKMGLWKEMCSSLSLQLTDPYMRAMFAFLTSENESYEEVLNEAGMSVMDRLAFACMYLSDVKLWDYIETLTAKLVESGSLDGVLLTGLTKDGVDLLERYVDVTGDIQTAAFVSLQGFPCPEIAKDIRVLCWIENYRTLLDTWRLWHQRAEFDVFRSSCDQTIRPNQQVFVSCNFCGKSVSYNMIASRTRHFMYGATTAHKPKVTCCPGCRKPLPRCALCLINMGTAAGTGNLLKQQAAIMRGFHSSAANRSTPGGESPQKSKNQLMNGQMEEEKLSQFSDWFTWCQTCRHGGHAGHMSGWFKDHAECPVTGCTCKCSSLDSMGGVLTEDTKSPTPSPKH